MNVLFTGLNGLIGSQLAILIGHSRFVVDLKISSFIRSSSFANHTISSRSIADNVYLGSCDSIDDLSSAISGSKPDLIVHLAQHRYTPNIIKALSSAHHHSSLLIVGTTGVFSQFQSCSSQYIHGEQLLVESGLDFCLIRPTMIYGNRLDKNMHRLYERINSGQLIVLPDNGSSKFQPVFYKDISFALFTLLERWVCEHSFQHQFINLPGPDILSLKDICALIASSSHKSYFRSLSLPIDFAYLCAQLSFALLRDKSPVLPEQILRLREDKIFQSHWHLISPSLSPTAFDAGIRWMIESYSR